MNTKGTIAHVGYTNSPSDRARILQVLNWSLSNGFEMPILLHDYIDLRNNRDFLLEDQIYTIVILHFLFRGGFTIKPTGEGRHTEENKQLAYSPHSSWVTWRHRLVNTEAQYIFAFGGYAEVGGSFIHSLPGYESIKVNDNFWVYKKQ